MNIKNFVYGSIASFALTTAASSSVYAMEVRGKADVPYEGGFFSSNKPSPELRQQAIEQAKKSAWNRYTSTFSPARLNGYQAIADEVLANLDDYVVDIAVLEDYVEQDSRIYSVSIRASINEAAFNARLNAAGAGSTAQAMASGELFTFIFVTREMDSLKSFDARRTDIQVTESNLDARQHARASGGNASVRESTSTIERSTTGGSTQRKANEVSYRTRSSSDVDAAMIETLSGYGFDVVGYPDVVANCGGSEPAVINMEFTTSDEMTVSTRSSAINAARSCEINFFAVGTVDIGMQDIDPVTGNQRVTVSVRGQVWDVSRRLPRNVASVGPIQYTGLGPETDIAMRNGLRLAAEQAAGALADQLNSKGLR